MANCTITPLLAQDIRQQLKAAIQQFALQRGDFVLASGQKSTYYIDCRRVTLHGHSSRLIGEALWQVIEPMHVDAVGGVLMGAAPLVTAVTTTAACYGQGVDGFLIRKAVKQHGMQRLVEGHLQPWMRVVLVEDVVTTGGSVVTGIEQLRELYSELVIEGVIALVDRQAGGAEAFQQLGVPYYPLFSVDELL